jgi:hypothetical protein
MFRFKECNNSFKILLKTQDINSLQKILIEHNSICQLVVEYNGFWKFILLIDGIMYSLVICFITYLGFFSSLFYWLKIASAICTLFAMFCFLIIFFSAAFIATEVSTEQVIKILIK